MAKSKKRSLFRRFLLLFWGSVIVWMFFQMQAKEVDDSILETSSTVSVENASDFIRFTPIESITDSSSRTYPSVLFYPGALVEAEAYAPFARSLAENGIPVIIQRIPFRMAFTKGMEKDVFEETLSNLSASPDSTKWVLTGHSKGGAMASEFAALYSEKLSGLLLIGTSHPRRTDLTNVKIPITKVYASEDRLASVDEVHEFSKNLPNQTNYVLIEGGNHSQFGNYGFQFGSGTAKISQDEQQQQLLETSLRLISSL